MSDEHADHHLGELIEGQGPTAIGWSEIRNALESIEMMRATGLEDARGNEYRTHLIFGSLSVIKFPRLNASSAASSATS
jgi:hypothetical protein